ncbi:MAG: hypothetical protein JJU06_15510 [Ectothiorhodospiraceae bacterium]|nr:hypothetical protein [Ectothiorhodospiraceae bacterium]
MSFSLLSHAPSSRTWLLNGRCGRYFLPVLGWILCVSLLALATPRPAAALTVMDAMQAAAEVNVRFIELCRDHTPAQARRALEEDERFTPYESSDARPRDDEILMIDRRSLADLGLNMTARAGATRCQIAVWPQADLVSLFLESSPAGWPDTRLNSTSVSEGETMDNKRQYRSDVWEAEDHYWAVEVMSYAGDSTVIGKYRRFRSSTVDMIDAPHAQWELGRNRFDLPAARMQLGDHLLELVPAPENRGHVKLEFHPRFYLYAHRDNPEPPLYYAGQEAILIDGVELPAYATCVRNGSNCSKSPALFRLSLDPASVDRLLNGRELVMHARTTRGERFAFRFSMQGASTQVVMARASLEQQLKEALARRESRRPDESSARSRGADVISEGEARYCARESWELEGAVNQWRQREEGLGNEQAHLQAQRGSIDLLGSRVEGARSRLSSCQVMGSMQGHSGCLVYQQQYDQLRYEYAQRVQQLRMAAAEFDRKVATLGRDESRLKERNARYEMRCLRAGSLSRDVYESVCQNGPHSQSVWCRGFSG